MVKTVGARRLTVWFDQRGVSGVVVDGLGVGDGIVTIESWEMEHYCFLSLMQDADWDVKLQICDTNKMRVQN